ncbi:hypothetical protein LCGC14_2700750 [marine sediment metagenome]|uniref:Uncharacterized protein n=1 Tax=marine sediment metagenome TaxID=412755 RepID=A0A0F8ZFS4_9ZZZZ
MLEDLAHLILEAQRIREESWDESTSSYTKTMLEASVAAGEESGFDIRIDNLVNVLLTVVWNDAEAWAESCLKEPE